MRKCKGSVAINYVVTEMTCMTMDWRKSVAEVPTDRSIIEAQFDKLMLRPSDGWQSSGAVLNGTAMQSRIHLLCFHRLFNATPGLLVTDVLIYSSEGTQMYSLRLQAA